MGKNKKILIVDDNEELCRFAERIVKQRGYNTLVAYNGKEAISIFEENINDIGAILLDYQMPQMDGYEVYNHIRNSLHLIPIIFLSGNLCGLFDRSNNVFDNFTDFISKPFNQDAIFRSLNSF